jgi:ABC transport system ATP-binding/permease protein
MKDLLAIVSGLQAKTPQELDQRFEAVDDVINGGVFDRKNFHNREHGVTAEQLYVNQKITDLTSKAEMEQSDYRNDLQGRRHLNVFFGPVKEYFGMKFGLLWFNFGVLFFSTLAMFFALYLILGYQIRSRTA